MANLNCGTIACPLCDGEAHVRRYKDHPQGKLYYWCGACGIIKPNLPAGQDYIRKHAVFFDPATPPQIEAKPPPEPAPPAPPAPKPRPAPSGPRFKTIMDE